MSECMEIREHPFTGVLVRNDGAVYLRHGRKKIKGWSFGSTNGSGYKLVFINGKRYSVHRLIAESFIPNPENKPFVDHLDRNRKNNSVSNLRWATNSENIKNSVEFDKVEARDGVHFCDNPRQWVVEYRKRKQAVRFSNGKMRWIDRNFAGHLLKIPLKERVLSEMQ